MSNAPERPHRLTAARWRKYSEWPLVAVGVVFVVAYSIEVIENVPHRKAGLYEVVIWSTWALFAVDYVVSLVLAERRGRWFVRNLHALAILVLPVLRPLRLLRLLFVLRITSRAAERTLRGRVIVYAFGGAVLITYLAALAVLDAEQNHHGGNIHTIGDAWWWAAVTISGVGYGDYYPVTFVGRMVAVALMIGGVTLIGLTAATMASWLIERVGTRVDVEIGKVERGDDDLRARVELLEGRRGGGVDTPASPATRPPGSHSPEQPPR